MNRDPIVTKKDVNRDPIVTGESGPYCYEIPSGKLGTPSLGASCVVTLTG